MVEKNITLTSDNNIIKFKKPVHDPFNIVNCSPQKTLAVSEIAYLFWISNYVTTAENMFYVVWKILYREVISDETSWYHFRYFHCTLPNFLISWGPHKLKNGSSYPTPIFYNCAKNCKPQKTQHNWWRHHCNATSKTHQI